MTPQAPITTIPPTGTISQNKKNKIDISEPTNFIHVSSVTCNNNNEFEMRNVPLEWKSLLEPSLGNCPVPPPPPPLVLQSIPSAVPRTIQNIPSTSPGNDVLYSLKPAPPLLDLISNHNLRPCTREVASSTEAPSDMISKMILEGWLINVRPHLTREEEEELEEEEDDWE